ncbi:hypothetical protein T484DRAFT_2644030 [Baffinella frigidus]|nr:hypothetical protein T484DRAFT_2644030 [Cryptophyta sp. CCMP2293]
MGYVNVTFPPGFLLTPGLTAVAAITGMSSPGTVQIRVAAAGSSLRFLSSSVVPAGTVVTFKMVDVRTALNTGAEVTFLVRTQNFLGLTSDQSAPLAITIIRGVLQNAIVEYSGSYPFIGPSKTGGTWNVSFVISSPLSDGHTIYIALPQSFTSEYPSINGSASYAAGFTFAIADAAPPSTSYVSVTFNAPSGVTLPTGSGVWFQLANITIAGTATPGVYTNNVEISTCDGDCSVTANMMDAAATPILNRAGAAELSFLKASQKNGTSSVVVFEFAEGYSGPYIVEPDTSSSSCTNFSGTVSHLQEVDLSGNKGCPNTGLGVVRFCLQGKTSCSAVRFQDVPPKVVDLVIEPSANLELTATWAAGAETVYSSFAIQYTLATPSASSVWHTVSKACCVGGWTECCEQDGVKFAAGTPGVPIWVRAFVSTVAGPSAGHHAEARGGER